MVENFKNWLGPDVYGDFLQIKEYSPIMRGVYSKKKIDAGTKFIRIPKNKIIYTEQAKRSSEIIKENFIDKVNLFSSPDHVFITIYMIETWFGDLNSDFKSYYEILPPNLNNIPLFWTEEQLKMLKGSPIVEDIKQKNNKIRSEYNTIVDNVPEFKILANFERYKYVRCLVSSRNFSINVDGVSSQAMAPLADMFNHKRPCKTKWGYEDNEFFVKSTEDIDINEEIMDSYGLKSNNSYFIHYGFVVDDDSQRTEDVLTIKLDDYNISLKLPFNNYTLQNELLPMLRKTSNNPHGNFINKQKDLKILLELNKKLIKLLDEYPQSLKLDLVDKKIVQDKFSNEFSALVIVSTEKKILQYYIECIFKILDYILNETKLADIEEVYARTFINWIDSL